MSEKMITMHIPDEILLECKGKGWHYKEVFLAGVNQLRGMPNLLNRITELEQGNKKLQKALSSLWEEKNVLEQKTS
jgi:hypothetical protein